jgi:hypothetical protein
MVRMEVVTILKMRKHQSKNNEEEEQDKGLTHFGITLSSTTSPF